MKFLILLICLLLQAFLNIRAKKKKYLFLNHYLAAMSPPLTKLNLSLGWGALLGLLIPILVIVLLLNLLFGVSYILYFLYGVIVLILCLDINDMKHPLSNYFLARNRDDSLKAQQEAEEFVEHPVGRDAIAISREVTEAIFYRSLTSIFSVIFWFMIFGPFGAVLYYMTAAMADRVNFSQTNFTDIYSTAGYLKDFLDWLPIRFVILTYALIGHFGPVCSILLDGLGKGVTDNRELLVKAGLTAIHSDDNPNHADYTENQKALDLITRTLWTWVIIIGVLTLTAWIF